MEYKINCKSLQGPVLTFTVNSFKVEEGFVVFNDTYTDKIKRFHVSNCEIEGVE